ncbi:MAG: permease [Elusimicrobiaceae bacterium]|nr:permease [Elusimicrobiaceae bacterium]
MFELASQWLTYSILGLARGTKLAGAAEFFFYDSFKIITLLFGMIFVIGVLRSYLSLAAVRGWTGGKNPLVSAAGAAVFGAITPFCSCSSVPIFLSFIKAGIPLGTAFSFLITSPLVNEYLVVLMAGVFGLKVAAAYAVTGMLTGMAAGLLIGRLKLDRFLERGFSATGEPGADPVFKNFRARMTFGCKEATAITAKVWLWVLAGVAVGAAIHNYVPQDYIRTVMHAGGIFSVPLAVVLGVPMYGSCAAIMPIGAALFLKGVPLGTTLAFLMAVAGLSLPEAIILRRAIKLPLLAVFFGTVTLGITLCGYLFNAVAVYLM